MTGGAVFLTGDVFTVELFLFLADGEVGLGLAIAVEDFEVKLRALPPTLDGKSITVKSSLEKLNGEVEDSMRLGSVDIGEAVRITEGSESLRVPTGELMVRGALL